MKIENKDLERIEVSEAEVKALLDRLQSILSTEDYGLLEKLVKSFVYATRLLEDQGMTIARFRKLLFGAKSEKLADVFDDVEKKEQQEELSSKDDKNDSPAAGTDGTAPPDAGKKQQEEKASKQKPKGHGRNGAEAYKGAEQVYIEHQSLKPGDPCPVPNCTGKLYELDPPRVFVWVTGRSPVGAEVFTLQALRCNLCLTVFTAELPEGVGPEKYDATAASVMAILRYGNGLPLNRLERLQAGFKIPLPAATQWDVVEAAYRKIAPAYDELEREAAQGDVLYNDDTTMKVLELIKENKERKKAREKGDDG
jgi:transposase